MTIQELYDWAKEKDLLDKPIAKSCNLDIHDVEEAYFLTKELTKTKDMIVLD